MITESTYEEADERRVNTVRQPVMTRTLDNKKWEPAGLDSDGLRRGPVVGSFEHRNKSSDTTKCGDL